MNNVQKHLTFYVGVLIFFYLGVNRKIVYFKYIKVVEKFCCPTLLLKNDDYIFVPSPIYAQKRCSTPI